MLEDIRLAFQGIWSHKLRSALTMLGIIIGIGSIIAIVSTIKGTNEQIKKNLVGAGNNAVNIQLYQGDWTLDLSYQEVPDGIPEISDQVLGEIQALDEVESAALYHRRNEYDAVYAGSQKLASCNIFGIDSNYLDAYGFQITKGRGFSEKDFTANRKVVLLDKTTATALFPDGNVIGKIIEVKGEPFTVIGMMARKENSQPVINSMEDYYRYVSTDGSGTICIPDTLWPIIYQYDEPQNLVVRATSTDEMTAAGEKAADILNNLSPRSLVLFDELGRGTSTYDGISIAWAIVEHIHEHKRARARTLFATHYHELNDMEESFPRIKNYNVSVKEVDNKVIFLRKLERGGSEHSFGIHVAKMAGMPKTIVKRADEILHQLEKENRQEGMSSHHKVEPKTVHQDGVQLSFFQLDDPVLCQIRDEILNLDVNNLTPLEALNKLNDIKKIVRGK